MGKIIFAPILFAISIFIFIVLDNGSEVNQMNQLIQPIFFAVTLTISVLFSDFRKYLILISIILLILLIFAYLFQMINVSNWLGSLGFGMLTITFFSYIPKLIKDGFLERF